MKVSIIIPCYNASSTIEATLMSISNQTYRDFEVIAVDDGSQDGTLDILYKWQRNDDRIVVLHQCNQGVSSARNSALRRVKGDYVCFVDADDIIENDYIEQLLNIISGNDSCDLAVCNFTRDMNIDPSRSYSRKHFSSLAFLQQAIIKKSLKTPQICCMLFKSEIIKHNNITFEIGCARGEDREFFIKYLLHTNNVIYTNDKLYHYRISQTSAMSTLSEKSLTSIDASWRTYIYYKEYNHPLSNQLLLSFYYTIWKLVVLCHLRNKMDLFDILQQRYDIPMVVRKSLSSPNITIRLTALLYTISPRIFKRLCNVVNPIIKKQ